MKKVISLRVAIVSLLLLFGTVNANVWYVHPDSTLNSIQAGIDSCSTNDTVLVGAGTYYVNITWPNTQGIHLMSESGPDVTIIDGGGVRNVMKLTTEVDSTTVINGFTIWHGLSGIGGGILCQYSSPTITGNTITGNSADWWGGGIWCERHSSPTITGNTITGNTAGRGGGIYCCLHSSPTITGNTITGNTTYTTGGGIYCSGSSPTITNNTITENTADMWGGGIYCEHSSPTIDSCTISSNFNDGVYCGDSSSPVINYNDIFGNTGYGVQNIDSNFIVDARYNWWGDPSGPGGVGPGSGDEVSNYVDYDPWLTEAGIEETTDEEIFFISKGNPNPFIDKTQIEYSLPRSCNVNIAVYNTLGARVKTLLNEKKNAGRYTITWDGRDKRGNKLPSGFYFLRLDTGEYEGTRKLLLIR